jgi:hypothetical protein
VGYFDWATHEENQRMFRGNSVNRQGDESIAAIRARQGLVVGLLRCGHCDRMLQLMLLGGSGANARCLCKGDYGDGGQYCLGFGGDSVDRRLRQELLTNSDFVSGRGSQSEGTGRIERWGYRTARRPVHKTRVTGVRNQEGV